MVQSTSKKKVVKKKAAPKKKDATKNLPAKAETAQQLQPVKSQSEMVMGALVSQLESGTLAPEQLSMVLDAQERVLDRQAKQEFNIAMSLCQADIPVIIKEGWNEHTKSKFEKFDYLNKVISPVYTRHGFAVSFGTAEAPQIPDQKFLMMRVTAEVVHRAGWSKDYQFDLPVDMYGIKGNENKTAMHGSASTMSYGRRYLLKMIFNLTTADELDDDGNAGSGATKPSPKISTDQAITLNDLIKEVGADLEAFLTWCKIEKVSDLPDWMYPEATKILEGKRK